ncbi:MAG: DUF1178 family protein [Pseudomonadota bacterium]
MIKFALRCSNGHAFEAWFANNATFDKLKAAGAVSCSVCGDVAVEKALMAPAVRTGEAAARPAGPRPDAVSSAPNLPAPASAPPDLSAPASEKEAALAALRAKIEAVSDNVGKDFAAEARRIHAGDAPQRPILGEASLSEAKSLVADDIPVMPLPWMSKRDA